jgi:hypothetical protein
VTGLVRPADSPPFAVGDRVWYVIPGLGAVPPIWLAVLGGQMRPTRVSIRAGRSRIRDVAPARLTTDPPPRDVTIIGSLG